MNLNKYVMRFQDNLIINRTKINTDGLVEYTKALEITMLKELGKLAL